MSRESHDALSIRIGIKRNSKQGLCLAGDRGADAKEDEVCKTLMVKDSQVCDSSRGWDIDSREVKLKM